MPTLWWEKSEGPGLLPTQIIESLLTHFGALTNPHLLATYAQIVPTLTAGLELGSRREQSSEPLCCFSKLPAYWHAQRHGTD